MKLLRILFVLLALLVTLGVAGWLWLLDDLPAWDSLPERLHTPSVRIVDRNDRLLYEALDEQGGRHVVVPIDSIPLACRQAANLIPEGPSSASGTHGHAQIGRDSLALERR